MKRCILVLIMLYLFPGGMTQAAEDKIQIKLPCGSCYQTGREKLELDHDVVGIFVVKSGLYSRLLVNQKVLGVAEGCAVNRKTDFVLEAMADGITNDSIQLLLIHQNRKPSTLEIQISYIVDKRQKPEAMADSFTVKEKQALNGTLQGYAKYGVEEYIITKAPRKGSLILRGNCFLYTPQEDASGSDYFLFRIRDRLGNLSKAAKVKLYNGKWDHVFCSIYDC